MKTKFLALLVFATIVTVLLCSCGGSEAKSSYKPPAEVFDVKISGTSEPEIDGVRFTYDSKARIDTVTFTYDGYEYKQEYSYDTDQVVIKTIYETNVIEEKVIKYVDIPVESGFTTIDGYIIRVTDGITNTKSSTENTSDVLSDILQSGYWIRYSPQFGGFDAFTFSGDIVSIKQYSYENGVVTPTTNDNTNTYILVNNTVIINDTYGSSEWEYENGKMIYRWSDGPPLYEETYYVEQEIFHHDALPSIETIQEEAYIKVY